MSSDNSCDFPSPIVDNSNNVHICFQKQNLKQYELIYRQKVSNKNIWSDETVIHSSIYPFENSSIISIDKNIFIYWIRNDIIYYSSSNTAGISWSKPSRYNFPVGRNLFCISYNTSIPYELNRIGLKDIPGSFTNGLRLAFYQDIFGSNNVASTQESLKNVIIDSIKYLKDNVDNFIEVKENLENQIRNLMLSQNNIIKEMDKCSIKLSLLEKELKQIKSSFSKLESKSEVPKEFLKQNASEKKDNSYNETIRRENIQPRKFVKFKKFVKKP